MPNLVKFFKCNEMAVQIWEWAYENNLWLSAAYVRRKKNIEADPMSINFRNAINPKNIGYGDPKIWKTKHSRQICVMTP